MSELKPCPFCGSAAEMNYHRPTESYYVACSGCTAHTCDHGAEPEQATETWNKRTQPEATKPAQDLSAAILALPLPEPLGELHYHREAGFMGRLEGYSRGQVRALLKAAAALASPADALVAGDRMDWREVLDDACIECEIPDSKYESLCIAINAAIQAQKDGHG